MTDIVVDGRVRVAHVVSIANKSAPTVAELNGGTLIHDTLTPDGLVGFVPDTADVDNSALASTFNTTLPGRDTFSGTMLRLKRQSGTDTLYNTLVKNFATHIVIRRDGQVATDAWAASDQVEVFPVQCGRVRNMDPEANSVQKYEVQLKMPADPDLRATVAA